MPRLRFVRLGSRDPRGLDQAGVFKLQKRSRDLAEAIIAENESLIRKLTADDLQMLLS